MSSEQLQACWMAHMRRGEWEAAWRISDRVLHRKRSARPSQLPRHLQPIWDGRPFAGRRVLVRCYHGLGDTVQFIRFAPQLRRVAASVTVWAQPRLLPLLGRTAGIDCLLPLNDDAPAGAWDIDLELMELPYALRTSLDRLPADVPYFDVGVAPARRPRACPSVGVVWAAGDWNPQRSVPLERMLELMRIADIDWKIFQRGPQLQCWARLQRLATRTQNQLATRSQLPHWRTVLEEARAMRRLDLFITVDTFAAHLAGALGVPTWLLLPTDADWRWMEAAESSPWYPTMRLFRQTRPGDWDTVIQQIGAHLHGMLRSNEWAFRADEATQRRNEPTPHARAAR